VKLAVIRETKPFERRVALTPEVCKQLIQAGFECHLEHDAGKTSFFDDTAYTAVGVTIQNDKSALLASADVVLKVNPLSTDEIASMKKGAVAISFMYAATNPEMVEAAAKQGISAFSVDAIPRISRAQKMDALSSQANLAGYKSVIIGAYHLGKIFPLLMTAAGTIKPAKVVIMGAGVAGLQAIATAKRLGAVVEVSDIRPETKEQVESLGADNIFVGTILQNLDKVSKDKQIVIHCQGGDRAAIGHSVLEKAGFQNIKNYSAGMNEWVNKGNPIETTVVEAAVC
jgi:NAD(P) transhydrogenase subunit alpha